MRSRYSATVFIAVSCPHVRIICAHSAACGEPARSFLVLAQARPDQLRRAGRADCDHASGVGGEAPLAVGAAFSGCAELLHAAAGAGSAAARHLYRLAAAPHLGWGDCRGAVCAAVAVYPDRPVLAVYRLWRCAAGGGEDRK